jgi:hypothetical protein
MDDGWLQAHKGRRQYPSMPTAAALVYVCVACKGEEEKRGRERRAKAHNGGWTAIGVASRSWGDARARSWGKLRLRNPSSASTHAASITPSLSFSPLARPSCRLARLVSPRLAWPHLAWPRLASHRLRPEHARVMLGCRASALLPPADAVPASPPRMPCTPPMAPPCRRERAPRPCAPALAA